MGELELDDDNDDGGGGGASDVNGRIGFGYSCYSITISDIVDEIHCHGTVSSPTNYAVSSLRKV